jgi:hypothetical protein
MISILWFWPTHFLVVTPLKVTFLLYFIDLLINFYLQNKCLLKYVWRHDPTQVANLIKLIFKRNDIWPPHDIIIDHIFFFFFKKKKKKKKKKGKVS